MKQHASEGGDGGVVQEEQLFRNSMKYKII